MPPDTIAGWIAGEPAPENAVHPDLRARAAASMGQTVMLDRGSAAEGFRSPLVPNALLGERFGLPIAISGSGVAYDAWRQEGIIGAWIVATASPPKRFQRPVSSCRRTRT